MVRPIARGHHDDTRARHFAAAEEGQTLSEIGIIERCQRLVAEGEGFFKSGNQLFLGVRPVDFGARRSLHPADGPAEIVISLGEVSRDVADAHLGWRRFVGELVGGKLFGGGHQVLG